MKCIKAIVTSILIAITLPMMAQTAKVQQNKKDDACAKVETVNGQTALVLKAGANSTIALKLDGDIWTMLDNLIAAPWGSSAKAKDVYGNTVGIAKANINSKVGLMFTSGVKCAAISREELDRVRN